MDGFRPCKFSTGCGYEVCVPEFCDAYDPKIETNADRIRAMDDEALAWELMTWRCEATAKYHGVSSDYPNTQETILKWLQQPCEEGGV